MPLDRIVKLCDEMIAADGDELPSLAHRTRVIPKLDEKSP